MARMRTIDQVFNYIKEHDPKTALTAHAIRRMVRSGQIPACRSGSKYLVDIDKLDSFLSSEYISQEASASAGNGKIRAVGL